MTHDWPPPRESDPPEPESGVSELNGSGSDDPVSEGPESTDGSSALVATAPEEEISDPNPDSGPASVQVSADLPFLTRKNRATSFLLGISGAAVVWVASALLLYSGDGLRRAAVVLSSVTAGSLAVGLWASSRRGGSVSVPRLYQRWRRLLLLFLCAVVYTTLWSVFQGFSVGPLSQGIGLALMLALPMYGLGMVLGSLGRLDVPYVEMVVAGPVAWGGAVGSLFVGGYMITRFNPSSLILFAAAALAAAALAFGRSLHPAGLEYAVERNVERDAPVPAAPTNTVVRRSDMSEDLDESREIP